MNNREVFQAAFKKVSNRKTWCQETLARAADGAAVSSHDPRAAQWCSIGACRLFDDSGDVESALRDACPEGTEVSEFNDTHSHAQVVALWKKAGRRRGWLP